MKRTACVVCVAVLSLVAAMALCLPAAAQEASKQGLRGEYYVWNPELGTIPDRAEVFKPENLRLVRLDPTVNFNWGSSSPDPDIPPDNFAVRWTGQVVPLYSEEYTFFAAADDGVQLWISDKPINVKDPGEPIIDTAAWTLQGETEYRALKTIPMEAGKKYYVLLEMYENAGGAAARFRWRSPSQAKQIVPAAQLIPAGVDLSDITPPPAIKDLAVTETSEGGATITWTAPADASRYDVRYSIVPITEENWATASQVAFEPTPSSPGTKETALVVGLEPLQSYYIAVRSIDSNFNVSALSNVVNAVTKGGDIGDGLKGEYYIWDSRLGNTPDRADVYKPENLKLTRIDPNVNFGWAAGVPAPGVRSDYFAVRWTGLIRSPVSEEVVFYGAADDGIRLWISESPIDPEMESPLIDRWLPQAETEYATDPLNLQAGKKYYVVLEMYEAGGDAACRLRWSSKSIPKQIISQAYLYSSDKPLRMGRLSGIVMDQNGTPFSRASVTIAAADRTQRITADANGYYTALLPEGKVDVTATAQGFTVQASTTIKANEINTLNIVINTGPTIIPGDVNGDGKLGIPDATIALQIAVGIVKAPTPDQISAGDLNKNGKIDIADVTKILRAAVGLEKLS